MLLFRRQKPILGTSYDFQPANQKLNRDDDNDNIKRSIFLNFVEKRFFPFFREKGKACCDAWTRSTNTFFYYYNPIPGEGTTKSRLRKYTEDFYYEYKYSVVIFVTLLIITVALVEVYKVGAKHFKDNTWTDSQNRSIYDPFLFDDESDNGWSLIVDNHDSELLKWIGMTRGFDPKIITQEDTKKGYFETQVYGQNRIWNISTELLLSKFLKYNKEVGDCMSAENFGLPVDVLFLKTQEKSQAWEFYYMIEPVVEYKTLSQNVLTYEVRDPDSFDVTQKTHTAPQSMSVSWISHKTSTRITEQFDGLDSGCIWRFSYKNRK